MSLPDDSVDIARFVRECPLFGDQPGEVVAALAAVAALIEFAPGEAIVEEGAPNHRLFVLVDGEAEVKVGDERVALITRSGDLMGEMSSLLDRRCAASIVARTPLRAFALDLARLRALGAGTGHVEQVLYRVYAVVLAEKLVQTNEKAKRVEAMNRELAATRDQLERANDHLESEVKERTRELEEQYSALLTTSRRLAELSETRHGALKLIAELEATALTVLGQQLDALAARPLEAAAREARETFLRVRRTLRPLASLYRSDAAYRGARVLLAESDRRQLGIARAALGGTGVTLAVAATLEEGRELLAREEPFDIVCASAELLELAKMVRAANPAAKVVMMTTGAAREHLEPLRRHAFVTNIVSRVAEDRAFTAKSIVTTIGKLATGDIFGLEKYLGWGAEVHRREIVGSEERWALVAGVEEHFRSLGIRETILARCAAVAEELLTNAIYDAPTDAKGRALYNHLPRTEAITLGPEQRGELRYACDGVLAAVAVEDPFGAFRLDTILAYLESCYGGRAGELNAEKGGAGLGTFQILESSDLVVYNVRPGERTEVIALFNLDPSATRVDSKSFHYFLQSA